MGRKEPLCPAGERGWALGGRDRAGRGHLLRGTLASKSGFAWTHGVGEGRGGRARACAAGLGLPRPGAGALGLSSSHFHLTVSDAALMSEGDNTWELKITIAST